MRLLHFGNMRVLYVHQNFPAQFGHIASHLANHLKWDCSFISETPAGSAGGVTKLHYKLAGGATQQNHFCSRTFENTIWHCDAVYQAMKPLKDFKPDLIVGHSGFGSTLFLRELYPDVPVINLFEYYYRAHGIDSDMDFRRDLGWILEDQKFLRARARNAMILLDLQNCDSAYAPTQFQKSRFPAEYQSKVEAIFDGVDRAVYHGHGDSLRPPMAERKPRTIGGISIPAGCRVVTYVSRGFESMRGFDIFIQSANRIAREFADVIFLVVGSDRIAYGGDSAYISPAKTFKEWTLGRYPVDPDRIKFLGQVPPVELSNMLAATDLHIYLTVPFVLSWSMLNAMSCGAVVLGSATTPVMEMIRDHENGLLCDFFDVDAFTQKAIAVLKDPDAHRHLGRAAEKMVAERYSLEAILPKMIELYERTVNRGVVGQK
jgi:glycosyltransferase involved in cell wall biosynthesis